MAADSLPVASGKALRRRVLPQNLVVLRGRVLRLVEPRKQVFDPSAASITPALPGTKT
jgi:hypothetical protein